MPVNAPPLSLLFRLLGLGALLFFASPAMAGSPWFTRVWQTDDGLPNNDVAAVVQGPDGYLWIGTPETLTKFDGAHFTKITPASTNAGEYTGVQSLGVSNGGRLWGAMQRDRIEKIFSLSSGPILGHQNLPRNSPCPVIDDDGAVWVAFGHLCECVKNGKTEHLGFAEGIPPGNMSFSGVIRDTSGNVWTAKGKRVGILRDGQFHLVVTPGYAGNAAQTAHLAPAGTNGIWIALGERLFGCDANGHLRDLGPFETETHRTEASTTMEDHAGAVWIGTDNNGLFRYGAGKFEKIETSHPTILSLAEDNEGNIWAGTGGGGLDRISRRSVQLENLNNGASLTPIASVCEGVPGVFWGVTGDGQLACRKEGQWRPMPIYPINSEDVTCVAADTNGSVWFGTRDRTLHAWSKDQLQTWNRKTGLASHTVVALLRASNGDLWMAEYGVPNAVQYLHEGVLHTVALPKNLRSTGRITSLVQDAEGNIWAGTIVGMLFRTRGDHFIDETRQLPPGSQPILCLCATADDALWIGFKNSGVGRLKNGHFAQIGAAQGLDDNLISEIVADNDGWLWFGGEHGIFSVRQSELEQAMADATMRVRPIRFGRNEGLSSMEANSAETFPYASPNAIRGSNGRLWMPLRSGLAIIDPSVLKERDEKLPVLITRVMVDGQTIGPIRANSPNHVNGQSAPLRLPPAHRHLQFSFTAINFSTPENVHFRYRLDGFDNQWIEGADTQRTADYSRLPPGNYHFEVEACDGDGSWNTSAVPCPLLVSPFFWETWWFRLASLIVLISCVVVIARYISFRRLHERLTVLQQQRALDQERSRIARDLHDNLGGSLTEVGLLVKMLDHHQHEPEKVKGSVRQIAATLRQVNDSLDQIVWAIDPHNDTLPHLIGFLGQSSMEFLRKAGIKCEMDLPDHPPKCLLTPEERHNLFLTVKEAINNIVRHAQAGQALIRVTVENQILRISIHDNGRGMNGQWEKFGSNGLRNMCQRMEEIGGQCLLETAPGKGTRVTLTFPIRPTEPTGELSA
ncbi:MAG TPA: two-component regulator propeller domain-containing protein [Verrucomicrobiae bacterium]|nr:two-component regulator propeller domain-containing protein [Verrucomicrobiae bacterium]